LGDDDDALLGDDEAALLVVFEVVADGGALGDVHVLVDDGLADAAVAAAGDALEQDRVFDEGETVDADVGGEKAMASMAALSHGAWADHAVVGLAAAGVGAPALVAKDEFGRGQLRLMGADGPIAVVKVQDGVHFNEVHVGLEIGVEGADVAPIGFLLAVAVAEA